MTYGDLVDDQLGRRGIPNYRDLERERWGRLKALEPEARQAFAASCAERLLTAHEKLPPEARRAYTLRWRKPVNAFWRALEGDADSRTVVYDALQAYYASEYNHRDGQDGPSDADDNAAAAAILAAECLMTGNPDYADVAGNRALEAAFEVAGLDLGHHEPGQDLDWTADPLPLTLEAMHPNVQTEIGQQRWALNYLERHDLHSALAELRKRS